MFDGFDGGAVGEGLGEELEVEVDPERETAGTGWLVMDRTGKSKYLGKGSEGKVRLPLPGFSRGVAGEAAASPPFRLLCAG